VGVFNIPTSNVRNTTVYLSAGSGFAGAVGKLVVGSIDSILDGPSGEFQFDVTSAEFESPCFYTSVSGVSRLVFTDASGVTSSYTGNVVLNAGRNVGFVVVDGSTVILNAGEGLGLNTVCQTVTPVITTINGIAPDVDGNFNFDTTDCASLEAITNGIQLINTCCKPCNSCTEVSELISRIKIVEDNLLALRSTYQGMLTEYEALKQALTCACSS